MCSTCLRRLPNHASPRKTPDLGHVLNTWFAAPASRLSDGMVSASRPGAKVAACAAGLCSICKRSGLGCAAVMGCQVGCAAMPHEALDTVTVRLPFHTSITTWCSLWGLGVRLLQVCGTAGITILCRPNCLQHACRLWMHRTRNIAVPFNVSRARRWCQCRTASCSSHSWPFGRPSFPACAGRGCRSPPNHSSVAEVTELCGDQSVDSLRL